MKFKQSIKTTLFVAFVVLFSGCDVIQQLQTAQQVNNGTLSVVKGDMTLPGAQKGGTAVKNTPYKSNYKANGNRYYDDVFQNVKKTTETYATGVKEFNGNSKDLVLDIYTPSGDNTAGRPCVVFIFGGGWFMKTLDGMSQFGESFAKKGYVSVSIDYRIGFDKAVGMLKCNSSYSGFNEAWYRGAQDAKAAIRYLKANADRLGIDKDKIFVGGHSAGAFTTLNAVHLDDSDVPASISSKLGSLNSVGSHQNENTTVAGEYILAGAAIGTLDYLDKNVPTYMILGTCDKFISDGKGNIYKCDKNPTIYAGQALYDKLKSNGACVDYDVSCGGDHDNFGNMTFEEMTGLVNNFIISTVKGTCKSSKQVIQARQAKCQGSVCN